MQRVVVAATSANEASLLGRSSATRLVGLRASTSKNLSVVVSPQQRSHFPPSVFARRYSSSHSSYQDSRSNERGSSSFNARLGLGLAFVSSSLAAYWMLNSFKVANGEEKQSAKDREKKVEQLKRVFNKNASVTKNGEKLMTINDFVKAIMPSSHKIESIDPQLLGFFKMADENHDGYVSLSEFIFFNTLMSTPEAEFKAAFAMFDINGDGKVSEEEFKEIMNIVHPELAFDKNSSFIASYFDANHKELDYSEFASLLNGLQDEVLRQEFGRFDKGNGTITAQDLSTILVAYLEDRIPDYMKDNLAALADTNHDSEISFSEFVHFSKFLMHVDAIEKTIRSIPKKKLAKDEFIAKVKENSDITILPSEADIVFQLFSNKDGELSVDTFLDAIRKRQQRLGEEIEHPSFVKRLFYQKEWPNPFPAETMLQMSVD